MTRVRRLLALPPADRRLLLQAWTAAPFIRIMLAVAGFKRCHGALLWFTPAASSRAAVTPGLDEAAHVARLVRAAARHGCVDRNCLAESLTLWWILRRRGIDSDIRIGVRKEGGGLDAHAWVECAGAALDEHPDVSGIFAPLVPPVVT